ncbi:MAG: ferritin-like domain-containing protein [Chloroflexota bacterium]|nr:ferritin-like domain-containing protein [Chloroflexota bacterium]
MSNISRRNILKTGAVAAGASAVSFGGLFGYSRVFGQTDGDTPKTMLDLAATAETFACTHYFNAINSAAELALSAEEVSQLKAFLDSELKHLMYLEANGGASLASEFFVPAELFTNRRLFVETSNTAENWFVAAYLAATRRFAELGEPLLAATTAQLVGVEAEHQALLRLMGGLQPTFQTLKEPLFYNTSEVAPLFQPFLEGADGFVGPAPFPGAEAILALVGDEGVIDVTPFSALTGGQGTMASAMMMTEGMMTGDCMVSASDTNIRAAASLDSDVVGSLANNTPMMVTGRSTDTSGFTWYQIEGGFVRSDAVRSTGDCSIVPAV